MSSFGLKTSFDRFGDDLSELILSFLTIGDKLRLECVSKQFRRLIFNKEDVLDIHVFGIIDPQFSSDLVKCLLVSSDSGFYKTIAKNRFELVLKKFKYINSLSICDQILIDNSIIETIAENCKYLRKLNIDSKGFDKIDANCVQHLGRKCGEKLESIDFSYYSSYYTNKSSLLYDFTPNIRKFCFNDLKIITSKCDLFYPKLEKIVFGDQSFPIQDLTRFADYYSKQIKSISIGINNIEDSDVKTDIERELFEQLSRFHNLDHLWLDLSDEDINYRFIESGLLAIGKKCKHLKHLDFETTIQSYLQLISLKNKFCKILSSFQSLIKCKFVVEYEFEDQSAIELTVIDDNRIERFGLLSNLEFLKIEVPLLNDRHFDNIDKCFPKLESIDICSKNCIISDKTLDNLAKIKCLTSLTVNKINGDISDKLEDIRFKLTDNGVISLINNCSKIRRIDFMDVLTSVITEKSIDAIVKIKVKPKFLYSFWFYDIFNGRIRDYVNEVKNRLPNNIEIMLIVANNDGPVVGLDVIEV